MARIYIKKIKLAKLKFLFDSINYKDCRDSRICHMCIKIKIKLATLKFLFNSKNFVVYLQIIVQTIRL